MQVPCHVRGPANLLRISVMCTCGRPSRGLLVKPRHLFKIYAD